MPKNAAQAVAVRAEALAKKEAVVDGFAPGPEAPVSVRLAATKSRISRAGPVLK